MNHHLPIIDRVVLPPMYSSYQWVCSNDIPPPLVLSCADNNVGLWVVSDGLKANCHLHVQGNGKECLNLILWIWTTMRHWHSWIDCFFVCNCAPCYLAMNMLRSSGVQHLQWVEHMTTWPYEGVVMRIAGKFEDSDDADFEDCARQRTWQCFWKVHYLDVDDNVFWEWRTIVCCNHVFCLLLTVIGQPWHFQLVKSFL